MSRFEARARSASEWRVAVLHQAAPAPAIDGAAKPPKPGGYRDSAADIAYGLARRGVSLVTPRSDPDPRSDDGWSFPDHRAGIAAALAAGADTLWANTVLYRDHPLGQRYAQPFRVVGQPLAASERFDDKFVTNALLRDAGLPALASRLVTDADRLDAPTLPLVVKPVRGRGSTGVVVAQTVGDLRAALRARLAIDTKAMVEAFLPGREITLTVLPPGAYDETVRDYWVLPVVERVGHIDGVAPYNGVVAVVRNSRLLSAASAALGGVDRVAAACARAAALVGATAPIRIDARQDRDGRWWLFDLNLKPNMTGAGRPGRADQDSLVAIAARGIGWSYGDLLEHLVVNAVPQERIVEPHRSKSGGKSA